MRHSIALNVKKLIAPYRFQRANMSSKTNIQRIHFANYCRPFVPNLSLLLPAPVIGGARLNRELYDGLTRNLNWGHFAPRRSS